MKGWGNLGVVDTIYEEEYECSSTSSPSLSPSHSSPPATLYSRVHSWSLANGCKTDVLIRVQGTCFHLHRDPLTSRSLYLKRQLMDHSELTLAPPLNISAQTFSLAADFCYGARIAVTPFNVAALRTAAELLQMTEISGDGEENLKQITEAFFRRIVTVNNREYALIVFRSCLALLPEAETTALLLSKCIEALSLTDGGYGVVDLFDADVTLGAEDFKLVAESMNKWFTSHDELYKIVDLYLQKNSGELTEEQKAEICNSIDCNKLSSEYLLHAVQNPRMPLRFIIRAMLSEQLNTRSSISSAINYHQPLSSEDPSTHGAILQRDQALRVATELKASMNATSLRLESLENELNGMKKLLNETEKERSELFDINNRLLHVRGKETSILESGRSMSFHYGKEDNKIERGERGSISSMNFRCGYGGREEEREMFLLGSSSSEGTRNNKSPKIKKNIRQRLIKRLKSTFWLSKQRSHKQNLSRARAGNERNKGGYYEDEGFMLIRNGLL